MEKMEEQAGADKMLHERTIRDLKKENEILLRDNDSLKFRLDQLEGENMKSGKNPYQSNLTIRSSSQRPYHEKQYSGT